MGWWWLVENAWYWFASATYPYPDAGGYGGGGDYATGGESGGCCAPDDVDAQPNTWYHCSNPEGYYPYVRQCNGEWEPVASTPEANGAANGGGNEAGDEASDEDDTAMHDGDADEGDADSDEDDSEDEAPGGY